VSFILHAAFFPVDVQQQLSSIFSIPCWSLFGIICDDTSIFHDLQVLRKYGKSHQRVERSASDRNDF
jgi:hypothetical protein